MSLEFQLKEALSQLEACKARVAFLKGAIREDKRERYAAQMREWQEAKAARREAWQARMDHWAANGSARGAKRALREAQDAMGQARAVVQTCEKGTAAYEAAYAAWQECEARVIALQL